MIDKNEVDLFREQMRCYIPFRDAFYGCLQKIFIGGAEDQNSLKSLDSWIKALLRALDFERIFHQISPAALASMTKSLEVIQNEMLCSDHDDVKDCEKKKILELSIKYFLAVEKYIRFTEKIRLRRTPLPKDEQEGKIFQHLLKREKDEFKKFANAVVENILDVFTLRNAPDSEDQIPLEENGKNFWKDEEVRTGRIASYSERFLCYGIQELFFTLDHAQIEKIIFCLQKIYLLIKCRNHQDEIHETQKSSDENLYEENEKTGCGKLQFVQILLKYFKALSALRHFESYMGRRKNF